MATNTSNYSLIKPAVNDPTDQNLWGGYLNTNFDTIDGLLVTAIKTGIGAAKTGNYSIVSGDRNGLITGDASGGAFDFDLPSASSVGSGFLVYLAKTDSSTNAITIDPDGSDTVGITTLANQYDAVALVSDGTSNWAIISTNKTIPPYPLIAQTTVATQQTTTSTSYVDVTSFSPSLTLARSNSKILLTFSIPAVLDGADGSISYFKILRDIDSGGYSDIVAETPFVFDHDVAPAQTIVTYSFLDTPASDGVITYKLQVRVGSVGGATLYLHYAGAQSNFIIEEKLQ